MAVKRMSVERVARSVVQRSGIGNIIGANVLNLDLITGIAATIRPLTLLPFARSYSFPWLMVFAYIVGLIVVPMMGMA